MPSLRFWAHRLTLMLYLFSRSIPDGIWALSSRSLIPFHRQPICRGHHDALRPFNSQTGTLRFLPPRAGSRVSTEQHLFPPGISLPFVDPNDKWGNWAVLLGCAAASQYVGTATRLGRLLGPPVTAMAVAFILASVGVICPGGTVAGKEMQLLVLQLATPLILLGASSSLNLRAARQCGPLLMSFGLASVATVLACVIGWSVAGPSLTLALGRDGLVIASALLAKNIGGGVNYVAVCSSLNASPNAVAAGLCVDNIFALLYFPATSALAAGRPDIEPFDSTDTTQGRANVNSITTNGVSNALFLSAALLWISERLGGGLPLCTLLALATAGIAPRSFLQNLQPSSECLGTVALYVFFATAGAPGLSVADSAKSAIAPISLFLVCLYSVHGLTLFLAHKLIFQRYREASLLPQRLLVASSAAIGGPATAVALAQASKWKSLVVPGLVVGNVGYAVATFAGLLYFTLLHP